MEGEAELPDPVPSSSARSQCEICINFSTLQNYLLTFIYKSPFLHHKYMDIQQLHPMGFPQLITNKFLL